MLNARKEIQDALNAVADAVKEGGNPEAIRRFLYADDMTVVGEGMRTAVRGDDELLPLLTDIVRGWGPAPDLHFTIIDPVIGGEKSITTMVNLRIVTADPTVPPEYLRIMYAWVSTRNGWRVAAEMFTVGSY